MDILTSSNLFDSVRDLGPGAVLISLEPYEVWFRGKDTIVVAVLAFAMLNSLGSVLSTAGKVAHFARELIRSSCTWCKCLTQRIIFIENQFLRIQGPSRYPFSFTPPPSHIGEGQHGHFRFDSETCR